VFAARLTAGEPTAAPNATNNSPRFDVQTYVIKSNPKIFANAPVLTLSDYTGTNISLERIAQAASEALFQFQKRGYSNANISFTKEQITNGIITLNVYQGVFPQVLISGKSWFRPGELEAPAQIAAAATNGATATNAVTATATNVEQHFTLRAYEITGNTLLSTNILMSIFEKATGTNVTLAEIKQAAGNLQQEYRDRGYPTVNVTLPPQKIEKETLKIRVFEGRLSEILVAKNHYFSSNNVMRALPSLETNMILLRPVFQAELDRANANQDRQIYPQLAAGPEPNTTLLVLDVKDRLPLHAKVTLNNENSPGTPDLRVNSSAVYNNLWQENHSLGVQYSFSPELYKQDSLWNWYDRPLVANYSGFYRLPLGEPDSITDQIASQAGTFGYDEATRKFNLPPSSGGPELNVYASRSTVDTGVETLFNEVLYDVPNVRSVARKDSQQDFTINNGMGFRLSASLPEVEDVVSTVSAGLDYKTYDSDSFKTNTFTLSQTTLNSLGFPNPPVISTVISPVPPTYVETRYLPATVRWDGSRRDSNGVFYANLNYSVNFLSGSFSQAKQNFENAAGSSHANGAYHIISGGLSREQTVYKDWKLTLKADGQWANQPLIPNEQFGEGGVNSVRGYHEGEVFGDTGWHISLEQKTPGHILGAIGKSPLIVRGSVYMDYADTFLLDPQGRQSSTALWGTGLGFVASLGTSWEARFLFSMPLRSSPTIEAYQPYFNFSLTSQF